MKTKIIATLGPSSLNQTVLNDMFQNGMSIIRLNSAYGNREQYNTILSNLRQVDPNKTVKVLFDVKDDTYYDYCRENKFEMIALSFAETSDQIKNIRENIPGAFLISKIESVKGVENYEEILNLSDGIMVARGDLSKAVTLEKTPPLQKKLTKEALEKGKFVIAATEMLLSMVNKPFPTNAEVSDVANAVFDGVHAVMLSEETAIGNHPASAVEYMKRIITEAENWCDTNECKI